jgi:rubrerythrin
MPKNTSLIEAYNHLIEQMYELMDDTLHSTAEALDMAKEKLSELGGLTQEEIAHLIESLTRDIHHAATNADETEENLSAWLKFDITLIENFALESFMGLADKTRVELMKLQQQAEEYPLYHSGDITSPGTFSCQVCDEKISLKSASEIPPCPYCNAKIFVRS